MEEEVEEVDLSQQDEDDVIDAKAAEDKIRLYKRLDSMSKDERAVFMKIVQFNALMELLDAIKNLKKTSADTWQNIIKKLKLLQGFNIGDKEKFDFNKLIDILLPLVGALAGHLLALKAADLAESASAEPEKTILDEIDPDQLAEANRLKSIVLQLCENGENGFSI